MKQRLQIIALLTLAAMLIFSVVTFRSAANMQRQFTFVADDAAPELIALGKIKVLSGKVAEEALSCTVFHCGAGSTPAEVEFARQEEQEFDESIAELQHEIAAYAQALTTPAEIELANRMDEESKALIWMTRMLIERNNNGSRITTTVQRLDQVNGFLVALVDRAIAAEEAEFQASKEAGSYQASQSISAAIVASTVLVLVFILLSAQLNTAVLRPLTRLKQAAELMGQGKLETRVNLAGRDELGAVASAFDQMAATLQQEEEEQQRVNKILQTSEENFRVVAENVHDIIVRYERKPEPHFAYVSPASTRIIGYTPEEHYADPNLAAKYMYPEDLPTYLELVRDPGKLAGTLELRYVHKNGSVIWIEMQNVAILDDAGELTSMIGVTRDITERKRYEEQLKREKEAALAAVSVKSEFLANMSHEIRTPLNAVIGMTSLLLDTPLVGEQRDFIETIRTSGDALLTVINDILDYSKIEARKLDLENQPFEIHRCVEDTLDLMMVKAAEKRLEVAYLIDPDVPKILIGDISRLRQILVNLVGNAIKFTEQGEVVVRVESRILSEQELSCKGCDPASWYELHFTVRDSGIGIPPDRTNRLFRSFSQVDASTTRKYGGTGLGLAISQQLSEIMGGSMWVESEGIPGRGATFHFTIRAQSGIGSVATLTSADYLALHGKRVLVVDDNATNRLILVRQLNSWGMQSIAAPSGSEALAALQQGESFDLAILDMCMPEMDGLTLAHHVRQNGQSAQLPLILLTSLDCSLIEEDARGLNFAAIIAKPVKQERLHDLLVGIVTQKVFVPLPVTKPSGFDATLADRLPLNILLVEDNLVNQKVARHMLARLGYRADVAANGVEALLALERQPYDVVLMDVQMPEMDGLEATRLICQRWPLESRPYIVAMTAHALTGDAERCVRAGMDDYISKPVQPEKLITALEQARPSARQRTGYEDEQKMGSVVDLRSTSSR